MKRTNLLVTIAMVFALVLSGVCFAEGGKDLLKSNIPQIYGKAKGATEGSSDLTVIHIQDAHGNVEAQENIQAIIKTLAEQGKVDALSDEGAWWESDRKAFDSISKEDAELVADFWTKYALYTGADRYQSLDNTDMPLVGPENKELKLKNSEYGRKSHTNKKETLAMAEKIKAAMEALKLKLFSESQRNFLQAIEDFDSDKITLTTYARTLKEEASNAKVKWNTYNNFSKVIESIELEDKIDFAKIDRERLDLIDELEGKVEKKVSDEIVTKSLNYRLGRLSGSEYYAYILNQAKSAKIDMKNYENVKSYSKLVSIYAEINDDALFAETDRLENAIKAKIFKSEAQINFDKYMTGIENLQKMIGLQMTRADLAYYNENKPKAVEAIAFLKEQSKALKLGIEIDEVCGQIDSKLEANENFYKIAMKRDTVLVENTLAMMDERGFKTVVLVAGGFHTEGIMKALKAKNVSHMIVTPRITNPDAPNYYLQNYLGEETEATKLLKEIKANTDQIKPDNPDIVDPTVPGIKKTIRLINEKTSATAQDASATQVKLISENGTYRVENADGSINVVGKATDNNIDEKTIEAFTDKDLELYIVDSDSLEIEKGAPAMRDGNKVFITRAMAEVMKADNSIAQIIATNEKNEVEATKDMTDEAEINKEIAKVNNKMEQASRDKLQAIGEIHDLFENPEVAESLGDITPVQLTISILNNLNKIANPVDKDSKGKDSEDKDYSLNKNENTVKLALTQAILETAPTADTSAYKSSETLAVVEDSINYVLMGEYFGINPEVPIAELKVAANKQYVKLVNDVEIAQEVLQKANPDANIVIFDGNMSDLPAFLNDNKDACILVEKDADIGEFEKTGRNFKLLTTNPRKAQEAGKVDFENRVVFVKQAALTDEACLGFVGNSSSLDNAMKYINTHKDIFNVEDEAQAREALNEDGILPKATKKLQTLFKALSSAVAFGKSA